MNAVIAAVFHNQGALFAPDNGPGGIAAAYGVPGSLQNGNRLGVPNHQGGVVLRVAKPVVKVRLQAIHALRLFAQVPVRKDGAVAAVVQQAAASRRFLMPPFLAQLPIRHDLAVRERTHGIRVAELETVHLSHNAFADKLLAQADAGLPCGRPIDHAVRLTDPGSAGNSHGVFSGIGQRLFHHHVDPAHEDLGDNDSVKRVLAVHKDKVGFEIEKITVILKHAGEPTLLLTELQVHGAAGAFKIFRLYHRLDIRGTDPFHALRHGQKRLDLTQNVHVSEAHQTNAIFLHNIHLICDQFPSAQKVVCSGTMLFVLIASGIVHMMSTTCLACSGGKPTGRSSSMAWIRS